MLNADIKEKETMSGVVLEWLRHMEVVCIGSCAVRASLTQAMCTFTLGLASQILYYNWLLCFTYGV